MVTSSQGVMLPSQGGVMIFNGCALLFFMLGPFGPNFLAIEAWQAGEFAVKHDAL